MNKELLIKIAKKIKSNNRSLEDNTATIDGVNYGVTNFDDGEWIDEGKYQYNSEYGQLCSYDDKWKIIEVFDYYLELQVTRSGSYFSDYYYEYEDVLPYIMEIVTIPEVVIPEHEDIKKVYI